jgi:UDP-2,3-diacylglucosamine pyrophosphatase LpxH
LGNHDESFEKLLDEETGLCHLGGVLIKKSHQYRLIDGREALILHGHQFDGAVRTMPWLYWLGDRAYGVALRLNSLCSKIRKRMGKPYWSLSAYLKSRVKRAVQFINNFEKLIITEAEKTGVNAVFSGHIHVPSIQQFGNITYYNDGDWCESCTAIVEDLDGTIRLVNHLHQPFEQP